MTRNSPPGRREIDVLAGRLRQDAEALRQPLPPDVKQRVLAQMEREPANRAAQRRTLSRPVAFVGSSLAGLAAAAVVTLAIVLNWQVSQPAPPQPENVPHVAADAPPALPARLPTWQDAELIEQPWRLEAEHLLNDTQEVGRFLLTRADMTHQF